MRSLRLALFAALLVVPFAMKANAQIAVGVGIGPAVVPAPIAYGPPVCDWGYYAYYPYSCAPYGYYGPEWFASGIFIGAGPWYRWGWGRGWGYRGGWHDGWRGGYGYRGGYGGVHPGNGFRGGYSGGGGHFGGYPGARAGGGFSHGGGFAGGGGFHGGGGGFHGGGGGHGGGHR